MYYVYLLVNEEDERYTGYTNDLKRRLAEHNSGRCFHTRGHIWELVYYEAYASKRDATRRELRLKDGRAKTALYDRVKMSLQSFGA